MKKIIIIFVCIVIGGLGIWLLSLLFSPRNNGTTTPNIIPVPTAINIPLSVDNQDSIDAIQPDVSTQNDVITRLGVPAKTETLQGYIVLIYPLENTDRSDKIYIANNIVNYISKEEIKDNSLYTDFVKNNHKKEDGVLYDPVQIGSDLNWYVFTQEGIAFLADKTSGYAIEVLRFPQISYGKFLHVVAPVFSLSQTPLDKDEQFQ